MRTHKQFLIFTLCLLGALLALHSGSYAYVTFNGVGDAYVPEAGKGESRLAQAEVEPLVVAAAGHFLKTHAIMMRFSNLYELSDRGKDFKQWQKVLDSAGDNLDKAIAAYMTLYRKALASRYRADTQQRLARFDYSEFKERRKMNGTIFEQVRSHLEGGDTNGVLLKMLKGVVNIQKQMKPIRQAVKNEKMPKLAHVWKVNESFATLHLFGQYVAMVFHEAK